MLQYSQCHTKYKQECVADVTLKSYHTFIHKPGNYKNYIKCGEIVLLVLTVSYEDRKKHRIYQKCPLSYYTTLTLTKVHSYITNLALGHC